MKEGSKLLGRQEYAKRVAMDLYRFMEARQGMLCPQCPHFPQCPHSLSTARGCGGPLRSATFAPD